MMVKLDVRQFSVDSWTAKREQHFAEDIAIFCGKYIHNETLDIHNICNFVIGY